MNDDQTFEALTSDLQVEMALKDLAIRGALVAGVARQAGEVYKAARKSGLPRPLAEQMALGYWEYEINGPVVVTVDSKEDDE